MATGHQVALTRHRAPVLHQQPARSQVPAFLQKLYEMLNDSNNFHLIRWSEAGDSFIVPNHEQFARELLGRWFKHQNFHSFVRQLNMYGFHKIPQLQQGVLRSDSDIEIWNFAHPHFRRGEPNLLNYIQRKRQAAQVGQTEGITEGIASGSGVIGTIDFHDATNSANGGTPTSGQVLDIQSIMNGINAIKRHQSSIQAELSEIKQSNQLLWQDAMDVRTKYQKQQDTINRIVKFLAGVFGSRPGPRKDNEVEALDSRAVIPRRRTRLMIEDGRNKKAGVMGVQEEKEDETIEAQFLVQDEQYPSIETPKTAPSPAASDNLSLMSEISTHFSSRPETHSPTPSVNCQPPPPPPYPHPTQANHAPQPQSDAPVSQDQPDHALTPSRSPNHSQTFDIQQALSQLTPQQISQLFSLSFSPLDSGLSNPPPSAPSQLTSYQPSPFDFSHLPQPSGGENEQGLISFDSIPPDLDKQWKGTDILDKEVNLLGSSIHSFMQDMQEMGLDPRHLDPGASDSLSPMLDSLTQQQPSLQPLITQLPTHLSQSQPLSTSTDHSSLLQVPSVPGSGPPTTPDDEFDMYSFLNLGRDNALEDGNGVGPDVNGGDLSTAFFDNVQLPPLQPERLSASPVSSGKSAGGNKRKSDVVLDEVQMEVPAPTPEPAPTARPPKRGGVKMDMNVGTVTRSSKRKKNK